MAFFKRVQKKVNDLWYPQSVTWGKAVTTREVADELSFISTVTRGDTYAVSVPAFVFRRKKQAQTLLRFPLLP